MDHSRTHLFTYKFEVADFLKWKSGQVRKIRVGARVKSRNKTSTELRWKIVEVPILYVQLIDQFNREDEHGERDKHHESLRRQSYVRQVLDAVGRELKRCGKGGASFRSKVLNPILQRYLRGVPDCYTPSVRAAISGDQEPTITDATAFYLSQDPVDPVHIPHYRRNLIYIVESRWHLCSLLGRVKIGSSIDFNTLRDHHDTVMGAVAEEDTEPSEDSDGETSDEEGPVEFSEAEIRVILYEGLDDFFEAELENTVCSLYPSRPHI